MDCLVSVVIPTYNRRKKLVRAIKSAQRQTYRNLEIIVVSDSSTDGTAEEVYGLSKVDSRIRFTETEGHQGANAARNKGIENAKGDYVAFLDDDDEWRQDKIQKQLEIIELNEKIGLVYTGLRVIYVNEQVEYSTRSRKFGVLKKDILLDNYIGGTSSVLCRKSLLQSVGGFDSSLPSWQDYDLWIRCCQIAEVGVVPEDMVFYYNNTGEKQISSSVERREQALHIINMKYCHLFRSLSEKEKKIKRRNNVVNIMNLSLRNSCKIVARQYAIELMRNGNIIYGIIGYFVSFIPYSIVLKVRRMIYRN